MNHPEHENLSALTDGELGPDQIRFLLRRVDGDDALRGAWSRYHLIGEGMRHEVCVLADDGFVEKVMQRIDADAGADVGTNVVAHGRVARGRGHHWLRWSAGGAIAAGVAVAALVLVRPDMNPASISAPGANARVATAQPATSVARPMAAPEVPRWLSASPSAAQMAQPAAANFYSAPVRAVEPLGYAQHLSPYMSLPGSRAQTTREARRIMRQLWSMAPRHGAQQYPTLWGQTAH